MVAMVDRTFSRRIVQEFALISSLDLIINMLAISPVHKWLKFVRCFRVCRPIRHMYCVRLVSDDVSLVLSLGLDMSYRTYRISCTLPPEVGSDRGRKVIKRDGIDGSDGSDNGGW